MASRVALVTGARQGMGAEIAGRLVRDGYAIAALDVLPCDDVVGEIEGAGGSIAAYRADVRSWQEVAVAVDAVEAEQGPIEALASVAGVWEPAFLELTPESWHRILDVNLEGSFNVCRLVTERMAARRRGSVVCIASNAAYLAWQGGAHYSASKAGLVGLVKGMALELGPLGYASMRSRPGPCARRRRARAPGSRRRARPGRCLPGRSPRHPVGHRRGRCLPARSRARRVDHRRDPARRRRLRHPRRRRGFGGGTELRGRLAVQLDDLSAWLDRYFAAWESNEPGAVAALFAEDAVYSYSPFREETRGREAIVREWVEGGLGEELRVAHEPLAVTGNRGIAHWAVSFRDSNDATVELDGIFVLDFDAEGLCTEHREWYVRRETPTKETR